MNYPVFVASCSPRRGGNTDFAAHLIQEVLSPLVQVVRVADCRIRPCTSCGFCAEHPGQCLLDSMEPVHFSNDIDRESLKHPAVSGTEQALSDIQRVGMEQKGTAAGDDAARLFNALCSSSFSFIVSPVYFYHVPAQAKAWIDRTQRYWSSTPGSGGILAAVLIGARPRGARLFEGARLTLRYMAAALGMKTVDALCLYGLDGPQALALDKGSQTRILEYARQVAGMSSVAL